MELSKTILRKAVGSHACNQKNEDMGCIEEITQNTKKEPQYIILSSDHFFGRGYRYFAVPICSSFIKIKNNGKIIINANKDDLQFARGVNINRCPRVKENGFPSNIYEVYQYRPSSTLKYNKALA